MHARPLQRHLPADQDVEGVPGKGLGCFPPDHRGGHVGGHRIGLDARAKLGQPGGKVGYCLVSATNSPTMKARTASSRIVVYRLSS